MANDRANEQEEIDGILAADDLSREQLSINHANSLAQVKDVVQR